MRGYAEPWHLGKSRPWPPPTPPPASRRRDTAAHPRPVVLQRLGVTGINPQGQGSKSQVKAWQRHFIFSPTFFLATVSCTATSEAPTTTAGAVGGSLRRLLPGPACSQTSALPPVPPVAGQAMLGQVLCRRPLVGRVFTRCGASDVTRRLRPRRAGGAGWARKQTNSRRTQQDCSFHRPPTPTRPDAAALANSG